MPQNMNFFTVMMYTMTGGRAYRGTADSPMGFLKLTTTGRKSGKQRTAQLMYLRDGSAYVITASNAGKERNPGWYYNLRSNPQVSLQAHGTHMSAVAEIADPENEKNSGFGWWKGPRCMQGMKSASRAKSPGDLTSRPFIRGAKSRVKRTDF